MIRHKRLWLLLLVSLLLVFPPLHEAGHIFIGERLLGYELREVNWWSHVIFVSDGEEFSSLFHRLNSAWQYLHYGAIFYCVVFPSLYIYFWLRNGGGGGSNGSGDGGVGELVIDDSLLK